MKKLGSYTLLLPLIVTFSGYSPAVHAIDRQPAAWGKKEEAQPSREALNEFATSTTQKAKDGRVGIFLGRPREIDKLINNMISRQSTLMINAPGSGKTVRIDEAARQLLTIRPDITIYTLKNEFFIQDDGKPTADGVEKLSRVINDLMASEGKAVLFIDEVHTMYKIAAYANILKPVTEPGSRLITVFGAMTPTDAKEVIDEPLKSRNEIINYENVTRVELADILKAKKESYQKLHGFLFTDEAMNRIAEAAFREFGTDVATRIAEQIIANSAAVLRSLRAGRPGTLLDVEAEMERLKVRKNSLSLDLAEEWRPSAYLRKVERITAYEEQIKTLETRAARIKEANELDKRLSELKTEANQAIREANMARAATIAEQLIPEIEQDIRKLGMRPSGSLNVVDVGIVNTAIGDMSGLPPEFVAETDAEKFSKFADRVASDAIGQRHIGEAVMEALRMSSKPTLRGQTGAPRILIAGPPGAGLDYIPKVLSRYSFGLETRINTLQAANYADGLPSIWTLMGSNVGYQDSAKEGTLLGPLRERPAITTNLQHVEMMHPAAQEAYAPIMDLDKTEDKQGRKVNTSQTLHVLTTEIGADYAFDKARVEAGQMTLEQLASKYEVNSEYFRTLSWVQRDTLVVKNLIKRDGRITDAILSKFDEIYVTRVITLKETFREVNRRLKEAIVDLDAHRSIKLSYDPRVVVALTRAGYDAQFGNEAVTQTLKEFVAKPLSFITSTNQAPDGSRVHFAFKRENAGSKEGRIQVFVDGSTEPVAEMGIKVHDAAKFSADLARAQTYSSVVANDVVAKNAPIPNAAIGSNSSGAKIGVPMKKAPASKSVVKPKAKTDAVTAPKPTPAPAAAPKQTLHTSDQVPNLKRTTMGLNFARRQRQTTEDSKKMTEEGRVNVKGITEQTRRDKK